MYCTHCGHEMDDNDAFCVSCGARAEKPVENSADSELMPEPIPTSDSNPEPATQNDVPQADASAPSAAPTMPEVVTPPVEPTTSVPSPATPKQTQDIARSKPVVKKTPIIVAAVALVVIAGILIAGFATSWFGFAAPTVRQSVEDYSWAELSRISEKIAAASDDSEATRIAQEFNLVGSNGKLDGSQKKSVKLADGTTVQAQIAGFHHDEKSDGSGKAGITFIFQNGVVNHAMNASDTNMGGWEESEARSWLNSDGLDLLPNDLKNSIVSVKKKTNNTGNTYAVGSVTETADKLWLFSPEELFGESNFYEGDTAAANGVLNAEGKKYKLFRDCATVAPGQGNGILAKRFENTDIAWWSRSPVPYGATNFCGVNAAGELAQDRAGLVYTIVPGFCL